MIRYVDAHPQAFLDGFFRLYPWDGPRSYPEQDPRFITVLEDRREDGARMKMVQVRFCPHGPWFTIREDRLVDLPKSIL